jgi:hypothetical protein
MGGAACCPVPSAGAAGLLDTNVLLSALLSPHGWPDAIYRAWQKDRFDLVTAAAQIDTPRSASDTRATLPSVPPRRRVIIMASNIENLIFETLKKIQAEQSAARDRDGEILSRLGRIELAVARVARDEGLNYSEIIEDRHVVDKLKERIDRIERRLQLSDG